MYLTHFQLREYPFGITPDTSFYFSSAASQQALNTLLVAARSGEGFIKITGEVGTGKTLLCRQLLRALAQESFQTAYIPNPALTPHGLLAALALELGVDTVGLALAPEPRHQPALLAALNERLLALAEAGQRVVVCLDEAQAMPIETLEALRLLTNLETEKRKLLQVVIFGQPELDAKLDHVSIRQLKQRITFDDRLMPLTRDELGRYLAHRMSVAGWEGERCFSAAAVRLIHLRTGGYPRLANVVAHKALLCAYGRGRRRVGWSEAREALRDTRAAHFGWGRLVLGATLGLVVASAASAGWWLARNGL